MLISVLVAALFLAALTVWEVLRFKLPYRAYLTRRREGTGSRLPADLAKILAGFLFAYLFLAVSLVSSPGLRLVYWFLFALAITVEHGYARALGHFTNTTDFLAIVHVDAGTRSDAIRGYIYPLMFLPSLVYAVLLAVLRGESAGYLTWSLLVLLYGVGLFVLLGLLARDEDFPTPGLSAFYRSLLFFVTRKAPPPRQPVSLTHRDTGPNIIFIVDESIRSDHLSVNGYARETTPYLDALQAEGKLVTWGDAVAGDTLSFPSNHALLTGIYPAGDPRTETAPTIFQYAKALGYRTCYFDAWGPAFWLGTPADLGTIDLHRHSGNYPDTPAWDLDEAIAREINALLRTEASPPKFIWVNKHGAHYGYQHCYPADGAVWKPEWRDSDNLNNVDAARHERLVNSYDNAILYNLNRFFQALLGPDREILRNTLILYTSDHAETLSDNGENWGHGRGTASERRVPAILIADRVVSSQTGPASHANLFATLLTMMDVPHTDWAQPYETALLNREAMTVPEQPVPTQQEEAT
jgi:glucan phosphoethanolaminetransferase (alkaline phosphatase superfamily)